MKILTVCLTCFLFVASPAYAQSGEDPMAWLSEQLELTQEQKSEMRGMFIAFLEKQDQVPTPGQVVLDNRAMLKDVLTSKSFDEQKARAFVQKITAVVEDASVNRLRLRHDLYQKLTPKQQEKFVQIVQQAIAEGMN